MATRTIGIMALLSILFSTVPAIAKGPTVQLTITGPGIDSPIHSSEKSVLSANVWFGSHFDWDSGSFENAGVLDSDYHIFFWVLIPRGHIEMKYMLNYRWDSSSDRAIVCLPGEGDPWYYVNVSSIIRGNEGNCFYAEMEWGNSIKKLLPK